MKYGQETVQSKLLIFSKRLTIFKFENIQKKFETISNSLNLAR